MDLLEPRDEMKQRQSMWFYIKLDFSDSHTRRSRAVFIFCYDY